MVSKVFSTHTQGKLHDAPQEFVFPLFFSYSSSLVSLNAEAASSCSNFENDSSDAESTRSLTPLKVKLQQSPTKISVSIPVSASMSQIGQDPKTLTKTGSARGKKNWEKYGKVRKACKVRYQNGNLAQLTFVLLIWDRLSRETSQYLQVWIKIELLSKKMRPTTPHQLSKEFPNLSRLWLSLKLKSKKRRSGRRSLLPKQLLKRVLLDFGSISLIQELVLLMLVCVSFSLVDFIAHNLYLRES